MKWYVGVVAALMVSLAFIPASEAKKCKKNEKPCGAQCVPKDAPCKLVRTLGGPAKADKIKGTPDKTAATGKSIDEKVAGGDKADGGAKATGGEKSDAVAQTGGAGGCGGANLNALDKASAEKLITDAGWQHGEAKSKETAQYNIYVYDVNKGGDKAVFATYAYTNGLHAQNLHNQLQTQGNVSSTLSPDGKRVIAAILPKGTNKAKAKEVLESIVNCK